MPISGQNDPQIPEPKPVDQPAPDYVKPLRPSGPYPVDDPGIADPNRPGAQPGRRPGRNAGLSAGHDVDVARRAAAAAALVHLTLGTAAAQTALRAPPLPPPRPAFETQAPAPPAQTHTQEQATPKPVPVAPDAPAVSGCLAAMRQAGFDVESAAQPAGASGACVIDTPVRLKRVPALNQGHVRLPGEPVLSCQFAERFGKWIGSLAAPVLRGAKGAELKAVQTGPGFECRNRNRNAAGKISAHAAGLAIDISAFELSDGSRLRIASDAGDPAIASLRTAGCGWFTTILGPGSDASHADHLHVDILQHGSSDRYRICQ